MCFPLHTGSGDRNKSFMDSSVGGSQGEKQDHNYVSFVKTFALCVSTLINYYCGISSNFVLGDQH